MWPVSCSSSFWLFKTQNGINVSLVVDFTLLNILNKVLYIKVTYLMLGKSLSKVGMICSSSSRLHLLVACLYERKSAWRTSSGCSTHEAKIEKAAFFHPRSARLVWIIDTCAVHLCACALVSTDHVTLRLVQLRKSCTVGGVYYLVSALSSLNCRKFMDLTWRLSYL